MDSETLTVRVDAATKKRLEELAQHTGRAQSILVGEAIAEYLDASEWRIDGVNAAILSLGRDGASAHDDVAAWISSWGTDFEKAPPKPERWGKSAGRGSRSRICRRHESTSANMIRSRRNAWRKRSSLLSKRSFQNIQKSADPAAWLEQASSSLRVRPTLSLTACARASSKSCAFITAPGAGRLVI